MRLIISLTLDRPDLPVDYRPMFLSLIKKGLSEYSELSFNKLYKDKDPIIKPFTFCVNLSKPAFENSIIKLADNNVSLIISTYDYEYFILLYNSLLIQKLKPHPVAFNNSIQILSIKTAFIEPISRNEITIKLRSPLVVREHNESDNTDKYLDYSSENFKNKLKELVIAEGERLGFNSVFYESFEIEEIDPKRTVVTSFGCKINSSLGVFRIKGDPMLLNYLYCAGIGSRRSQGFGMFDIVG